MNLKNSILSKNKPGIKEHIHSVHSIYIEQAIPSRVAEMRRAATQQEELRKKHA